MRATLSHHVWHVLFGCLPILLNCHCTVARAVPSRFTLFSCLSDASYVSVFPSVTLRLFFVYIVLHQLAGTYLSWGKISEAIEKYEKSLMWKKNLVDGNQLDLSSSTFRHSTRQFVVMSDLLLYPSAALLNLGICYENIGQIDRASSLYQECLAIRQVHLPSPHPSLSMGKNFTQFNIESKMGISDAMLSWFCSDEASVRLLSLARAAERGHGVGPESTSNSHFFFA